MINRIKSLFAAEAPALPRSITRAALRKPQPRRKPAPVPRQAAWQSHRTRWQRLTIG